MLTVSLIGAGKVTSHLARTCLGLGVSITGVWSLSGNSAQQLCQYLNLSQIHSLSDVAGDVIFLAVPDDHIESTANALPEGKYTVVHCSGNSPLDVLNKHSSRGVIYPFQTFPKLEKSTDKSNWTKNTPLLIEAATPAAKQVIDQLANTLSKNVQDMSSQQRRALHIAGVFSNNFTTALMDVIYRVCNQEKIDPKLLDPIIKKTITDVLKSPPAQRLTGPASRCDHQTMKTHQAWLKEHMGNEEEELYVAISKYIAGLKKD